MNAHFFRRLAACLTTLLALSGTAAATVNVVTTTTDLAALTTAVGGDNVKVNAIARGDMDPHFIDAKPSYMVKLSTADLVICVGLELEIGWLPSLLTGARNPKIQPNTPGYLDASATVKRIGVPTGTIDRSRGDLHPQGNPHYWLNPENGRLMARAIEARLEQLDPKNAAAFKSNLAAFEQLLTTKESEWTQKMAPLKGAPVIGYHSTFDYFADTYGMKVVGFVEPKPGIPPTPSHTLEMAAAAKANGVKMVMVETYHNGKDAGPITNASGAKILSLPSSVGGTPEVKSYTDLFDTLVRLVTSPS